MSSRRNNQRQHLAAMAEKQMAINIMPEEKIKA